MSSLSSAEFRHIENRSASDKADRLFRAAVSAFCALRRPTRAEIAQLDDLALPLFGEVSHESRRFAAAALSECEQAPPLLVRRLAGDAPEIAAPLLIRSKALKDVDLIMLIARHGVAHARIIARRPNLPGAIEDLLTALRDPEIARLRALFGKAAPAPAGTDKAEPVRSRLRDMMRPAGGNDRYRGLLEVALTGRPALFETRLADFLGLELGAARVICRAADLTGIIAALKSQGIVAEQAFVLLSCIRPGLFGDAEAIGGFLDRFAALDLPSCRRMVADWKAEAENDANRPRLARA